MQSMEFSRPEYWSGQPFLSPGNLPDPGIKSGSPALQWILYQLSHKGSPRDSWEGVKISILTGIWNKLISTLTDDLEGFKTAVEEVT